jgi:hypothetical protein
MTCRSPLTLCGPPDGKSFAYTGLVNGDDQVFVRRLDNLVAFQVTRTPAGPVAFWSPDSSRVLYYEDYTGDDTKLWSVAVAGGEPELVRKDFDTAALSPHGKVLAVLRRESGVDSVWVPRRPALRCTCTRRRPSPRHSSSISPPCASHPTAQGCCCRSWVQGQRRRKPRGG